MKIVQDQEHIVVKVIERVREPLAKLGRLRAIWRGQQREEGRGHARRHPIQGNGDGSTAVDYTVHCATGYPAVTGGGSAERPVNQVLPAWDIACAYQAAFAVVAAVDHRRRSGQGAALKIALSDMAFVKCSVFLQA